MTNETVFFIALFVGIGLYLLNGLFRQRIPQSARPPKKRIVPPSVPTEGESDSVPLLVAPEDIFLDKGAIHLSEIGRYEPQSEKNRSFRAMRHALVGYEIFSLPLALRR